MLENLTIYIPTYYRHEFLHPILDYYSDIKARIIICDATPQPWKQVPVREGVSYFHLPDTTNEYRYIFALNKCQTHYFVPRADRRHQTKKFLREGVNFLENNPEYESVYGIWLNEDLSPYQSVDLISNSFEIEDAYNRLTSYASSYTAPFYAIQRLDLAKRIGNLMTDLMPVEANMHVEEYVHAFYACIASRIKKLPLLHGIVQSAEKKVNYHTDAYRIPYYFMDKSFQEKLFNIAAKYMDAGQLDLNKAREAFFQALEGIVTRYYINTMLQLPPMRDDSATLARFAFLEEIFRAINAGKELSARHVSVLRNLMHIYLQINISFHDIKKFLYAEDYREIAALQELMRKCKKQDEVCRVIVKNAGNCHELKLQAKKFHNAAEPAWLKTFPRPAFMRDHKTNADGSHDYSINYYTSPTLYKNHVLIKLEKFSPGVQPAWLRDDLPVEFYYSIYLIDGRRAIKAPWNKDKRVFEINAALTGQDTYWAIRIVKGKLPYMIAVSDANCMLIKNSIIPLPVRATIALSSSGKDMSCVSNMTVKTFKKIAQTILPYCAWAEFNNPDEHFPDLNKIFEECAKYDCGLKLRLNFADISDKLVEDIRPNFGLLLLDYCPSKASPDDWAEFEDKTKLLLPKIDREKFAIKLYIILNDKILPKIPELLEKAEMAGLDGIVMEYPDPILDAENIPSEKTRRKFRDILIKYAIFHPNENFSIYLAGDEIKNPDIKLKPKKFPVSENGAAKFRCQYPYAALPVLHTFNKKAHPHYVCAIPLSSIAINSSGDFSLACHCDSGFLGKALSDDEFFSVWEKADKLRNLLKRANCDFGREDLKKICPECAQCIIRRGIK